MEHKYYCKFVDVLFLQYNTTYTDKRVWVRYTKKGKKYVIKYIWSYVYLYNAYVV